MNKKQVITEEDVEAYYTITRKYKFKIGILKPNKYKNLQKIFNDLYVDKKPTYFCGNGKLQCEKKKYRSVDDFIRIVKYYLPNTTVKGCIKFIGDSYKDGKNPYYFRHCPDIKKWNLGPNFPYLQKMKRFKELGTFKGQGFSNCTVKFIDML